jgi:hypothetical protein
VRTALHLILTPVVFVFGAKLILGGATVALFDTDLGTPDTPVALTVVSAVVTVAAVAGGVAYGWHNRRR